ncbi:hypothetical protein [Nocardiopsis ganjiahuensis]|uniref:hypothetical protein n=1 Tax=Nocardiopsis ganjiahuensis TaxID=239984 RepID=UPI000347C390|nr:hypothetical protein [Nocardiopsis ganjiahuensis]
MHTSPYGYLRELIAELRRNRARRVRRYAETVPFVSEVEPRTASAPPTPAPSRPADDLPPTPVPLPADDLPAVDPRSMEPSAVLVRSYFREWERREALRRVDRSRLGVAVLHTIAEHGEAA